MADKLFIIAGTVEQYRAWVSKNIKKVLSRQVILYVYGLETLKGYQSPHGLFIGTWYQRSDIQDILLALLIQGSITQETFHELQEKIL